MKRPLVSVAALVLALVSGVDAAETVYRSPVPPGGNPAAVAAPRDDWRATVQGKFDQYSGKHFDIVFDGDSITNRWQTTGLEVWSKRYAGIAADFGIEGDRVENVLWRLDKGQLDGVDPKVIVLMIGTNNVGRDTAAQIADGIKTLVGEYKKRCPQAHIILMGVFPRDPNATGAGRQKMAAVNSQIAALGDGKQISYVNISSQLIGPGGVISPDMMPDYLHPSAKGYRLWADAIQPIINQFVPPKAASPVPVAAVQAPAAEDVALITFSGLYNSPNAGPLQSEIPPSYQPLLGPAPRTAPADGKNLRVIMAWDHAISSNRGANAGVHDHTGDDQADDQSLGGGVMYATVPFTVSFNRPVEVPSLFWTYYNGGGTPLTGSISAYRNAADTTAVKSVEITYKDDPGYVWREEKGFAGLRVSKLVFDPGGGSDGLLRALNIDDITIRADGEGKR